MSIANIVITVRDLEASVTFYRRYLDAGIVERDAGRARLDLVTATIELVERPDAAQNPWDVDDLAHGFKHLGFKVGDVDGIAERLVADGIELRIPPIENPACDVRACFFADPDGVALEIVERHVRYQWVFDAEAVDDERTEPTPPRPRFDHVAVSVPTAQPSIDWYGAAGYAHLGAVGLAPYVPLDLDFLRAGRSLVELLSPRGQGRPGPWAVDARGLTVVEFAEGTALASGTAVARLDDGRQICLDPGGLPVRTLP